MSEQIQAFIELSPEIKALLADNQVELTELLQREGIQVATTAAEDPATSEDGAQGRDVFLILLGSAAIITALTPVLTKIIQKLSEEKVVAEEKVLKVSINPETKKEVLDKNGNPVMYWTTQTKIVSSEPDAPVEQAVNIEGPLKIKIGYSSKPVKS